MKTNEAERFLKQKPPSIRKRVAFEHSHIQVEATVAYFLVIRGGSRKKIAKKNRPIMQAKIKT
jgi:hypothetical protein